MSRLLCVSTLLIPWTISQGQCTFSDFEVAEACTIDEDLNLVTTIQLTPTFSEACTLSEYCFSKIGDDLTECVNVSALEVGTGTPLLVELPGPGIYLVWASTTSSSSEFIEIAVNCYDDTFECPNPFAVNYVEGALNPNEQACIYNEFICDCSGIQHSIGVLSYLGDNLYNDGTLSSMWEGNTVDFSCNVWGFDCGDANIYFDPYDVCNGDLPPNNGCGNTGCTPLTLEIVQGDCVEGPSGLESSLLLTFGTAGGCLPSSLFFTFNSGVEQEIDLSGNASLGEPFLFLAHEGPGTYQFHFETSEGAVSPYFYKGVIDQCADLSSFCDCAGQQWFMSSLSALGNGLLNDGLISEDGKYLDFNCQTWAYDCGDNPLFSEDAFNICEGGLPPENGCFELVIGCMNPVACNFDPTASIDDASCMIPEEGFDCDGNCISDIDEDGICDQFEVLGCSSPDACNYDMHATDDDGSCEYDSCFGCTEISASNYNPEATMDDGSCIFLNVIGCAADINEDGFVNTADLLLLMAEFGSECAN